MRVFKYVILTLLLVLNLSAHEGHDMPGAMPPAPHGGEVKAAEHAGEDKHDHANEAEHKDEKKTVPEIEVFFEAVYSNKTVKIYPLQLSPKNQKTFVPLATNIFSSVEISIELPRQKKIEKMKVNTTDTYYEATFDPKSAFRFFAIVAVMHDSEVKKAKIQVELE